MGTLPMFDEVPTVRDRKRRRKAQKPVAWGRCPSCTQDRTAVVRTASHLVWREHENATYGKAKLPCQTSGVPLCRAPDRSGEVECHHPPLALI